MGKKVIPFPTKRLEALVEKRPELTDSLIREENFSREAELIGVL